MSSWLDRHIYRSYPNIARSWYTSIVEGMDDAIHAVWWRLRYLGRNTVRSIRWAYRMWGNEDWDQEYFYLVMQHKLEDMHKYFSKSDICHDNRKITKDIGICIHIIKRVIEDDYLSEEYDKIDRESGPCFDWDNGIEDERGCTTIKHLWSPEADKRFERYIKLSRSIKDNELDLLFKILRRKSERFWD